ncbi:MAG: hypothetical protein HKN44_04615 [Ilumatobacter sp.]|nr:hypothetical protein [Ilumatobacter sp.]
MVVLVALVVAAIVVPVVSLGATLVRRRRWPDAHPDQRLADGVLDDARRRKDESRIESERIRGRQWPH